MAVLNEADRAERAAEIQRRISALSQTTTLSKAQWRVLIDAADTFCNDNAAAYNSAIPQPTRGIATAAEKALALELVVALRRLRAS